MRIRRMMRMMRMTGLDRCGMAEIRGAAWRPSPPGPLPQNSLGEGETSAWGLVAERTAEIFAAAGGPLPPAPSPAARERGGTNPGRGMPAARAGLSSASAAAVREGGLRVVVAANSFALPTSPTAEAR
jgi:hypothetical protein